MIESVIKEYEYVEIEYDTDTKDFNIDIYGESFKGNCLSEICNNIMKKRRKELAEQEQLIKDNPNMVITA